MDPTPSVQHQERALLRTKETPIWAAHIGPLFYIFL